MSAVYQHMHDVQETEVMSRSFKTIHWVHVQVDEEYFLNSYIKPQINSGILSHDNQNWPEMDKKCFTKGFFLSFFFS